MKILISWIGRTDLNCAQGNDPQNLGPIAMALTAEQYDFMYFLYNYPNEDIACFKTWIKQFTSSKIIYNSVNLSSPTNHKEIYKYARDCIKSILNDYKEASLTFHTSPGTPAMATTWMLLSPVYGARLIESSKEAGVKTITLPFEVAAYFLPDRELVKLSESKAPNHPAFKDIIYTSSIMEESVARAQHVAPRDITVLIEGESGTGKELFARAIHESSKRNQMPFITVNCGAIPSELIESILFGHEKGAFTGTGKRSDGHFHNANGGTLFLDELGEISPKAQVALLRALKKLL